MTAVNDHAIVETILNAAIGLSPAEHGWFEPHVAEVARIWVEGGVSAAWDAITHLESEQGVLSSQEEMRA